MEINRINEICDLNNDCLIAVFKQFKIGDLCAVGLVCQRFRAIAQYVFSLKYGQKFNIKEKVPLKVFRLFGGQMVRINLKIREFYDNNNKLTVCRTDVCKTVNAYRKYCPNLRSVNVQAAKWRIIDQYEDIVNTITKQENFGKTKQHTGRKRNKNKEENVICAKRMKLETSLALKKLTNSVLVSIFEQLNLSDLSSVAEASKRFHKLALYVFHKKYANKFVLDRYVEPRTMRIFGHLITKITVKFTQYKNNQICKIDQMEMLRLMHRYAKNVVLLNVNTNIHGKLFRAPILGKIFSTIKILRFKLENSYDLKYFQDIQNTMGKCQNLLSLVIYPYAISPLSANKSECYEPFLIVKYPVLRHFTIHGLTILNGTFVEFCTNHNDLITLKLAVTRINKNAAMSIMNLKSLQSLQFIHDIDDCIVYDYTEFCAALAKISTLRNLIVMHWIDGLIKIKQLTGLIIVDSEHESTGLWKLRMRSIATQLINLKNFGYFTTNLPLHLVDLVRYSKTLQSIYVNIDHFPDNRLFDKFLTAVKYRNGNPLHIFPSGQHQVSDDRLIYNSHKILVSTAINHFWTNIIYTEDFHCF